LKTRYNLHIITNGFEEVQHIKLQQSNLTQYFGVVITSENAGYKKPEKGIFEYTLNKVGVNKEESLMIGDGIETDIAGAIDFGMDSVYFNPNNNKKEVNSTHAVTKLIELIGLL